MFITAGVLEEPKLRPAEEILVAASLLVNMNDLA
jgi:hypothetical protein